MAHSYPPASKLALAKALMSVCHLSVRLQVSTNWLRPDLVLFGAHGSVELPQRP